MIILEGSELMWITHFSNIVRTLDMEWRSLFEVDWSVRMLGKYWGRVSSKPCAGWGMLGTSCQVKYWWELTEIPQGQQHLSPWTNLSVLTFSCCCHTWYYRVLGPIPFHILTLHSVLGSELQEAVREINALKLDALLKTKSSRTNMETDALESLGVNGKSLSWQSFNHTEVLM